MHAHTCARTCAKSDLCSSLIGNIDAGITSCIPQQQIFIIHLFSSRSSMCHLAPRFCRPPHLKPLSSPLLPSPCWLSPLTHQLDISFQLFPSFFIMKSHQFSVPPVFLPTQQQRRPSSFRKKRKRRRRKERMRRWRGERKGRKKRWEERKTSDFFPREVRGRIQKLTL